LFRIIIFNFVKNLGISRLCSYVVSLTPICDLNVELRMLINVAVRSRISSFIPIFKRII
jgi:hypothetical protein